MADPDEILRDYDDYTAERRKIGDRLAGDLEQELLPTPDDTRPQRRSPLRLLYVTSPLAALALAAIALVSTLSGPPAPVARRDPPQRALSAPPPTPSSRRDGPLTVSASLDQATILAGSTEDRFLVIEFDAGDAVRAPIHIAAVVDTSGSMSGDKIVSARRALTTLSQALGPEDTLSIIGFSSDAHLWLREGSPSDPALFDAITSLSPSGGTAIGAGLSLGLDTLSQLERKGSRRVLLMSDGISNERPDELARLAASRVEQGISVSTIGLGLDFDNRSLLAMSDAGGGSYRYVDRPEILPELFAQELGTMAALASRGVSLQVDLAPGVEILSVYGYGEHDGQILEHGYRALVGDMHAGQPRKVVARLKIPSSETGEHPVASLTVRYTDPRSDTRREIPLAVQTLVTQDPALATASISPKAGLLAARAIQGDALQRAQRGWSDGDPAAVTEAQREGDALLSHLEERLGDDVGEVRRAMRSHVEQLESLSKGSDEARSTELRFELEAQTSME